jgi:hypothetical protein
MSSALRRLIAGGCTVVLLIIGVQLLGTTAASAHSNNVSGTGLCQSNGTYTVTWTVTNDYDLTETATVNSHSPSGSSLSANSVNLAKSSLDGHSATIFQTGIAGNVTSAALNVQGHWSDNYSQADGGSVSLLGTCKQEHQPKAPDYASGKCDSSFNPVSPTITIFADTGVSYTIDGQQRNAGTYQVSSGQHTVEATSSTLTLLKPTSWTFTLDPAPADCNTEATPVVPTVTQSKCDNNHQPTNPVLNLPSTLGITYSVNKSAPYSAGQTVLVTAAASAGYEFKDIANNPWTFVDTKTETLSITFDAAPDCITDTTPTGPGVNESVCNGNTPSNPTLDFPNTPGIDYTTDKAKPFSPGETVLVTATLQNGFRFTAPLTGGWSLATAKTATKSITFAAAPDCRSTATPVNPDVKQSVCPVGSHVATTPDITWTNTSQVHYSATPPNGWQAGDDVTITATAQSNYRFDPPAPSGWSRVNDTTETFVVHLSPAPDCRGEVSPAAPTLTPSACPASGTTPVAPTLTLPTTVGVTYSTDKQAPYAAGETVVVTAATDSGYKFAAALPPGWDRVSDSKATYDVVFDAGFACGVPENPSLTQSICPTTGTAPTSPTLTFPTTDGVDYTASPAGPYKAGDVVVVTATAQPGHQFDTTAPAGWTILDNVTETYTVTFDAAPSCAQPVTPTFSDDQCVGNTPSSATYTIPGTTGVDYYVDSVLTQAGTYTATDASTIKVEAKPQTGYTLVGTSSWTHNFPATPNCNSVKSVKVVRATFTNDKCVNEKAKGATYTIGKVTGASFTVNGRKVSAGTYRAAPGSTVSIVATALPGYTLKGQTSWTHSFGATPKCHGTQGQHVHRTPPPPLASTGVPTATILGVGIGLLLVGGACTFLSASRRRRSNG